MGDELIENYSSQQFATPIIDTETREEINEYIYSLNLSNLQKTSLVNLYDILFTYNAENLCDIIEQTKNFEAELLASNEPSEIEAVLISSSIGRFALAYWNDRVKDENSSLARARGFWKKFFTAVADALGGTAGAIAGSATVLGGIAGGVAGAVSVSAGFSRVWDVFAE